MDPALQELYAEGAPEDEVAVVIRLVDSTSVPDGVRLVTRFGDIATCRVRRSEIVRLHASEFVKSVKAPRRYLPGHADSVEFDEDIAPLATDVRRPPELAATGRGTLLCHIDWGADFTAQDFRTSAGRTRFRAIWDQGAPYDPMHPNRYGYGRIYRTQDIDRALAEPDPVKALGYDSALAAPSGGSHGSHTLGISGGNGRSGGPPGMAPEADLAFVDMSTRHEVGISGLGDSAAFLEALDFFAELASELGSAQPLVVNASLGRQCGQHDGKTLTERGMDAFLLAAPGRAICQSAGNYFDRLMHSQGTLLPGESRELHISIDNSRSVRHEIDMWYAGDDRIAVAVQGPNVERTWVEPNSRGVLSCAGRTIGRIYHRMLDPNNGDNEITIFLDPGAPSGEWQLYLDGRDIVDGRYHAWIERAAGSRARFLSGEEVGNTTTGTIANGLRTISVGAYDAHREQRPLAHFSSGGPTRTGRRKPDLVAPGMRVLSVRSRAADELMADPPLMRMSGTSMASPCAAGVVALMFGVAPRPLTIQETRRLLLSSAQLPPAVDAPDQARFGCGYLDVTAAVRAAQDYVAGESAAPVSTGSTELSTPMAAEASATAGTPTSAFPQRNDDMQTPLASTQPAAGDTPATDPLAGILSPDLLAALPPPPAATAGTELQCRCTCHPAPPARAPESTEESAFAAEADRSSRVRQSAADNRRFDPGFQVQLPIGGGAPALALPFGGAASPFAFTIPLGGTPAPVAPVVVSAAANAAAPAPPAASDPTPSTGAPVTVAADTPLFVPAEFAEDVPMRACSRCAPGKLTSAVEDRIGETLLLMAEPTLAPAARRPKNSSEWLRGIVAAAMDDSAVLSPLPYPRMPSATSLFNAFVYPDERPVRHRLLLPQLGEQFQVLARPLDSITNLQLRAGDVLIRVSLGQAHSHIALLASPDFVWHSKLGLRRWTGEGHPFVEPGLYVHVLECLPRLKLASDRFARRIADGQLRLLGDTLLLRVLAQQPRTEVGIPAFRVPRGNEFDEQAPGPDSAVADRFIPAHASRFCSPGQAGSLTCTHLPTPRPIRRVVIHVLAVASTSSRSGIEAVVAGWQNKGRQAASHYLVDRDGKITQMVREADVAFHTPGNNEDSIGIEHADVCNDPSPLTDRLYARSAELVRDIAARNGFTADATTVRGHSQVNPNHDDPGPYWDWEFYLQWLAWSGQVASRPCRRVAATSAQSTVPAGWQVQHRRAIANDFCADARDPWGETYLSATSCDANSSPAEVSVVLPEVGSYDVSLWWPRASDASAAVPVEVEVACLQSPCVGASLQNVVVNQKSGAGVWNSIAVVHVARAPSELKLRWHCPAPHTGRVLADAVRALKIATRPNQSSWPLAPEGDAESQPIAAPRSACAYFFKGGKYVRYSIGTDKADFGPSSIATYWHLPQDFQSDIDAVVNWGNGKVYFFKGPNYLRYSIATDRVDVPATAIAGAWPTLPARFRQGIHAAINWGNGKVYFFKDAEYVRYDIATDAVDVGPKAIAEGWPTLPADFQDGLQAAVNWGNGKAYFFKDAKYVRYDIKTEQADFAPLSIAEGWPNLPAGFQSCLGTAVNWTDPCDLVTLFESIGVRVIETPGWRTAGVAGTLEPVGIMMHHTAGNAPGDLATVINGRAAAPGVSALSGPLANFYVGRNAQVHMIAAGKANHAGPGSQTVLQEVLTGVTPSNTASARRLTDGPSGNGHFYGFECENLGDGAQAWPEAQLDAMARAAAALCQRHCWSVDHIISHAEWTARKVDPRGFSMADFRQRVGSLF